MVIVEKLGTKHEIGAANVNVAIAYTFLKNYPTALEHLLRALNIFREMGYKDGMATSYNNIGEMYNRLSKFKLAIQYSDSSLQLSKQMGDINRQRLTYHNLAFAYAEIGEYKKAYENHVICKQLTDSIFNAENSKQLGDLKTKFEVEKKEAELKIKAEAQEKIAIEEKKKQQVIIFAVAGVLFIVMIFSLFLYKRFRITRKQKKIIEEQKVLVDHAYESLHEKNQEVMDSINYAKRIQMALITSEKYIASRLNRLNKN